VGVPAGGNADTRLVRGAFIRRALANELNTREQQSAEAMLLGSQEIEIRWRGTYIPTSFLPAATLLNPSLHA